MSKISKLLYSKFQWSEYLEILSFFTLKEIYLYIGRVSRNGYMTYLREKSSRECPIECRNKGRLIPALGANHDKILLASYPRSGNSYLRRLIESYTGIISGSDSSPNRPLSSALLKCGYAGEGIVDRSVWVIKSHFPERNGYISFPISKVILIVRNPFDSIESYFHLGMTNTHNKNLTNEVMLSLNYIWKDFILNEANVWRDFHEYWIKKAENKEIDLHIIRYEDLLQDKEETMNKILKFMKNSPISKGLSRFESSNININKSSASNISSGPGYKPKGGGIGKSLRLYSDKEIQEVVKRTKKFLDLFGYCVTEISTLEINNNNNNNNNSSNNYNYNDDNNNSNDNNNNNNNNNNNSIYSGIVCNKINSSIYESEIKPNNMSNIPGVLINILYSVRDNDDKYGRLITNLRRSITNNDINPFETNK